MVRWAFDRLLCVLFFGCLLGAAGCHFKFLQVANTSRRQRVVEKVFHMAEYNVVSEVLFN